ncbi:MAG: hypothetical protein RL685_4457 [Pseudomonadota bacterium]|jgi:hypothetical protein
MNIKQATKGSIIVMASALALTCACGDEDQHDHDTALRPGPYFPEGRESGPACTAVGCDSDFAIELEQPEAWPLGSYEVFVTVADGGMESCVIELGGPVAGGAEGFCTAESFTVTYVTGGRLNATSNRGVGSSRDAALATGGPAIASVHVDRATATLATVVVIGPNGLVSQGSFEPAWGEYFYPNGPECTPSCRTAPPQTLAVRLPEAVGE